MPTKLQCYATFFYYLVSVFLVYFLHKNPRFCKYIYSRFLIFCSVFRQHFFSFVHFSFTQCIRYHCNKKDVGDNRTLRYWLEHNTKGSTSMFLQFRYSFMHGYSLNCLSKFDNANFSARYVPYVYIPYPMTTARMGKPPIVCVKIKIVHYIEP